MQISINSHPEQVAGVREEVACGFEANGIAFYAQISGLAKDKIGYPIREICTNAWDAAQGDFDVTLPTEIMPIFRVRDRGTGMSHADMLGRFARMYASDKRQKADQVGGWGLGRFSPFAYLISNRASGSYTVVSVHEGVARSYVISLSEAGQPMIRFMGERPSADPAGLDVFFAVEKRDIIAFRETAKEILWSFQPRPRVTPTVDFGEPVVLSRGNGWTLFKRGTVPFQNPTVRMGCVSYEIDLDEFENSFFFGPGSPVLFDVPIGSVKPTLSRESLQYDDNTKGTIAAAMGRVEAEICGSVRIAVEAAPTILAAYAAFRQHTEHLNRAQVALVREACRWQDQPITPNFSVSNARIMHLPARWGGIDGFRGDGISVDQLTPDTRVILQHNLMYSIPKLNALGLAGQPALWIRCKKADRDDVLARLRGVDVVEMDAVKVDVPKREKTSMRKRRVFTMVHASLQGSHEMVDMEAGGYYVDGNFRTSDINIGVHHHEGVPVNRGWANKILVAQAISLGVRLGLFDEQFTIVIRNDGESLGDNWLPLSQLVLPALEGVVNLEDTAAGSEQGRYSMPEGLRKFPEQSGAWPQNTPAPFRNLASEVGAELTRLDVKRPRNDSDDAVEILNKFGIRSAQPSAAQRSFRHLEARLGDLLRTYPLYRMIAEQWSTTDRRGKLQHYFDLCEKSNVALDDQSDLDRQHSQLDHAA